MKIAFFLSLKDIRKNLLFLLVIYLQIVIFGVIIMMAVTRLPEIMELKDNITLLDENKVTTFKSYYKPSVRIANMPQNVREELVDVFDNQKIAYSTSTAYDYSIPEYPDKSVLIVVGNFADLYSIGLEAPDDKPQAYIGNSIKDIPLGTLFTFGGETTLSVSVVGSLKSNSSYFYRTFKRSLDNTIVIITPYKVLPELFGTYLDEELIQNTNFIHASEKEVIDYVKIINASKIINVLPFSASYLYEENFKNSLYSQWFFLVFFSIAFIFNLLGIIANLMNTINNNLRGFAIHYLYGATIKNILERIGFYILFILLPPVCVVYLIIDFTGLFQFLSSWEPPLYFVFFVLVSALIVSIYPIKKLYTTNLQDLIRRD